MVKSTLFSVAMAAALCTPAIGLAEEDDASVRVESDVQLHSGLSTGKRQHAPLKVRLENARRQSEHMAEKRDAMLNRLRSLRDDEDERDGLFAHLDLEAVRTRVKAYLESMQDRLEEMKARVEASERIDADAKANLLEMIQADIDVTAELLVQVDDATAEELQDIVRRLHDRAWHHFMATRHVAARYFDAAVMKMMERADAAQERLHAKIDELREQGEDVSVLVEAMVEADAFIADAHVEADAALELFAEAKTADHPGAYVREGVVHVQEARELIKAARDVVKNAIRSMR